MSMDEYLNCKTSQSVQSALGEARLGRSFAESNAVASCELSNPK